jgi:hypothetical protein
VEVVVVAVAVNNRRRVAEALRPVRRRRRERRRRRDDLRDGQQLEPRRGDLETTRVRKPQKSPAEAVVGPYRP